MELKKVYKIQKIFLPVLIDTFYCAISYFLYCLLFLLFGLEHYNQHKSPRDQ